MKSLQRSYWGASPGLFKELREKRWGSTCKWVSSRISRARRVCAVRWRPEEVVEGGVTEGLRGHEEDGTGWSPVEKLRELSLASSNHETSGSNH